MSRGPLISMATIPRDLTAGLVVFLVALPLCLGVALASNAPLFSGVVAGIVGGILVGMLSGSHTSVSGSSASLTAVVAAQIASLGSFSAFLLAVVIAGGFQIALGLARCGFIAAFFPSSVIKGLLAAIGVILILKQIPHLLGHDTDPDGEMAFQQPDHHNTFSEFFELPFDLHWGASVIGLASILLLLFSEKCKLLKKSGVPAPLIVVLFGAAMSYLFQQLGGSWMIEAKHLVQVPVADSLQAFFAFFQTPDFSQWSNPAVWSAGVTIALIASLETLLNLEAVDKLDTRKRISPASRELVAQGIGNVCGGMLGGIPVSSVIVRSSVNINAGSETKLATITHGVLLLVCVMFLPVWLNMIPLSCLAAILLVTGARLVSPTLLQQTWEQGRYQFIPFAITVIAIVVTDLSIGVAIGLVVSLGFILNSNLRRPVRRFVERHLGGEVLRIELANQVSFLNRAALTKAIDAAPRGGHVLLDASNTDYIDPDVLELIREFKTTTAPARGIEVSLRGFRTKYHMRDDIQFVDYSTRELQSTLTPAQVLQILKDGHERFRSGQRLTRDLAAQMLATAEAQHPLAVVLSCIDSRAPVDLIFDVGLGDILSIRIAGNVTSDKVLGSIEYGCAIAGAKLILVMGHTRCGAVTAAVQIACSSEPSDEIDRCRNVATIVEYIQHSIDPELCRNMARMPVSERQAFVDQVARANVVHAMKTIHQSSETVAQLVGNGRVAIVGAVYDVQTGEISFLPNPAAAEQNGPQELILPDHR